MWVPGPGGVCRPGCSGVVPSISVFLPVSLPSLGSHAPVAELGAPGLSGRAEPIA